TSQVEHLFAPVDPGQRDGVGVELEVEAGADGDFQGGAGRLAADPLAGVAEQVAVKESDFAVVGTGFLVPVSVPSGGAITGGHGSPRFESASQTIRVRPMWGTNRPTVSQ